MVNYPQLSLSQQQTLPELIQFTALEQMFDDSTHQLWQCTTVDGEMMLKVCDEQKVKNSSFWQGMSLLFAVDLPQQLGEFYQLYQFVSERGFLTIPDYIASSSVLSTTASPAFILAKMISGTMIDATTVDDEMVKSLAKQLSQLHQNETTQWGSLVQADLQVQQWSLRLVNTLERLAEKSVISEPVLEEALSQAKTITAKSFVPIMLDLRWDQFLQEDGQLSALVDLDAFVFGPRELELVMLEYLLTEQQADIFRKQYQKNHIIPDLSSVRTAYRLLLFLMNILGEKDVDAWMQTPTRF